MICNMGKMEQTIRIVLGIALIGAGAFADLPTGGMVASYVVGAVALFTGAMRYCPAWQLFGINTCPTGTSEKC